MSVPTRCQAYAQEKVTLSKGLELLLMARALAAVGLQKLQSFFLFCIQYKCTVYDFVVIL